MDKDQQTIPGTDAQGRRSTDLWDETINALNEFRAKAASLHRDPQPTRVRVTVDIMVRPMANHGAVPTALSIFNTTITNVLIQDARVKMGQNGMPRLRVIKVEEKETP